MNYERSFRWLASVFGALFFGSAVGALISAFWVARWTRHPLPAAFIVTASLGGIIGALAIAAAVRIRHRYGEALWWLSMGIFAGDWGAALVRHGVTPARYRGLAVLVVVAVPSFLLLRAMRRSGPNTSRASQPRVLDSS